ncbi:mitochondrial carrier protein MTM1 isoform X7 [Elaeis guineensis]|uniref:Mitochondrial carrier protein MTM1 isoform X6 n=1 Tax=Elaeis guineensis var. tenera TaxID=51953 RepID=A0A6J0PFY8_ELAGV|nr:mitochondrial carrier protein MTM1 isoform X6 [Elaeis guineensis]
MSLRQDCRHKQLDCHMTFHNNMLLGVTHHATQGESMVQDQFVLPIVFITGEHWMYSTRSSDSSCMFHINQLGNFYRKDLLDCGEVGIYLPCYDILRNWIEEFTIHSCPNLTPYAPLVAGSISRSLACLACSPIELARTRMQQAFKESRTGARPLGMWRTLLGVLSPHRSTNYIENLQGYCVLWTGVGAQLARDVPFSAICWSTLEPIRRSLLGLVGEEGNAASVIGANFSAGFVAGSFAAAATCPLDVAKTRRQIEKDPAKVLKMTTRRTLAEIWRKEGVKGLFTGVGPRVGRAGPSVGIVVSFYEIVKYALHRRHANV